MIGGGGGGGGGAATRRPAASPPRPEHRPPTAPHQVTQGLARLQGCFGGGVDRTATGKVTLNGLLITPGSASTTTKVSTKAVTTNGPVTVSAGDVIVHRGD